MRRPLGRGEGGNLRLVPTGHQYIRNAVDDGRVKRVSTRTFLRSEETQLERRDGEVGQHGQNVAGQLLMSACWSAGEGILDVGFDLSVDGIAVVRTVERLLAESDQAAYECLSEEELGLIHRDGLEDGVEHGE